MISNRFCSLLSLLVLTVLMTSILSAQQHSTTLVFPTKKHSPIRKATGTHLFFAVGSATSVDNPQGTAVVKLSALDDTTTEKDDDELTVYGINAGKNEIIYNTSLFNIEIYRHEPGAPGALNNPRGIAADRDGNVYVADMGNHRILHLVNREGKNLVYHRSSSPGNPDFTPFGVALTNEGTLFVTDSTGGKIWKWIPDSDSWEPVLKDLNTPLGICTYDARDRWTHHNSSQLGIITDAGSQVLLTDYQGEVEYRYKPAEKNVRFRYIAADYYNNYYLTDAQGSRIIKINRSGKFVDTIGERGKGDYQFLRPQGISIWKRFGQVCVAESYAAQYYLIGTDILSPSVESRKEGLQLSFQVTERARVTITARHIQTDSTFTMVSERPARQGEFSIFWPYPESFPTGRYLIDITAVPSYSSTKYFQAKHQFTWDFQAESNSNIQSRAEERHE